MKICKRIAFAAAVMLCVLCAGCGGEAPKEPPELTVVCGSGSVRAERGTYAWEVMKRGSEVESGIFDYTFPTKVLNDPLPIDGHDTLRFVFPEGMEPDGSVTGSFYRIKNGEIDWTDPLGVSVQLSGNAKSLYGEDVYGFFPQIYGSEGVYELHAQWNRPKWRGRCDYFFAVTELASGEK